MPVYWVVRVILQPFFHLYFRMRRIGLEHIPKDGPGADGRRTTAASPTRS